MLSTAEQKQSYARDGGFRARGFPTPDQLARARDRFDWGMANPGPLAIPTTRPNRCTDGAPFRSRRFHQLR